MPRGKRVLRAPRGLTQQSIEGFFGSTPPSPGAPSNSRARPQTRKKQDTRTRGSPIETKPRKTRATKGPLPALDEDGASSSSDVGAITFEPIVIESSSDEDDEEKSSPRRPTMTQRSLRLRRAPSNSGGEVSINDSDEEGIKEPVIQKGKAVKRKQATLTSSEDEEPQPRRKKLIKGVRPPTPEADDLREEVDEHRIIQARFRNRSKASTFQKNLERLRRKKRGEAMSSDSGPSEDESDHDAPFAHAKPNEEFSDQESDHESQANEEEEDTFIVEDDNDAPELPAEFSMSAHQDLKHHFKIICQLFVHVAVQDRENRKPCMKQLLKDQYFSIPLSATRRKITGMRDSLVASSVWRSEFKKPLETHPEIQIVHLDFAEPHCDACHLGGRLSTRVARVSGSPYDPLTYESIKEEEDDDDDDGDSDNAGDEEHKPKNEFRLGRFCAARTHAFHQFTHWEFALFKALEREIDGLRTKTSGGSNGRYFIPVQYAGTIKPPDDLTDADGMMAWLDSRKIIDMEWQKVREMMENARKLDISAKKGGEDD